MRTSFRVMAAGAATAIGFLGLTLSPTMANAATPLCVEPEFGHLTSLNEIAAS
jgi:hypothetical protein